MRTNEGKGKCVALPLDLCKDPNYVERMESVPLNPAYISYGELGRFYKREHLSIGFYLTQPSNEQFF